MFEENLNREDDQHTQRLIQRFEDMVSNNHEVYFDSDDLEIIIDHYYLNDVKENVGIAIRLSEKLFPFSIELKIKKAQILISMNEVEQALTILEDIKYLAVNLDDFSFTLSVAYSKQKKHKKAINILQKLYEKDPDNIEVISSLANEYQCINDHYLSCSMIEKLIVLDLENDLYWYSYFLSAELIENNSNAISFAKKIIEKQPYCLLAWFYLGLFYQKQEDHLNAIEAFDYAILIDQEYTRTYSYKAESLAEIGHFQKAIDCCLESIEFEEPNCNTYFEIGEYYEKLDKLDKALAYFYKSLRKDNLFADAWYSIALILDFQGNHLESLYHIKQALENNKTNIDYLFLYAEVHEKVGFMKEAQIAYKKVLEIDNLDQESWLNYSNILYQQESTQDAIDALYNAIEYNPNNAKIYFRLSAYLIETGDKTKGLNLFKHALTINYDLHAELFQYMPKIKDNKDLINLLNNFKNEF